MRSTQVKYPDGDYGEVELEAQRLGLKVPAFVKMASLAWVREAAGHRAALRQAEVARSGAVELAREVGVSQSKKMAKVSPTPPENPLPESERSPAMGGGPVLECRDCGKPSADPGRNHREHTIDCRRFRMGVRV